MPRPATDPAWRERVRALTENEPRLGPAAIAKRLQRESPDAPSARTVSRMQAEYRQLGVDARTRYRVFTWPQHMEAGLLPWEAGAALLELVHHVIRENEPRPLLTVAEWYWRVTLAAPGAPLEARYRYARRLAGAALLGGSWKDRDWRAVGLELAHKSWEAVDPNMKLITAGEMLIDALQQRTDAGSERKEGDA